MNLAGADCSQPIRGLFLARAGIGFVGRYMGRHPEGDLTVAEHADHAANGVADLLLWEFSTDDLGTKPSAFNAAEQAIADAQMLGAPMNRTVAAVLCEDNVNPNVGQVQLDMAGAAGLLRGAGLLAIFYGRKDIARTLIRAGAIDGTFVVDTWGADQPGDRWNFRQLPNAGQRVFGGVTCDLDDAPNPIGLWAPTSVLFPPIVTPVTGDPDVAAKADLALTLEPDPTTPGKFSGYGDVPFDEDKVLTIAVRSWNPATLGRYVHFEGAGYVGLSPGITRIILTADEQPPGPVGVRVWETS